MSQINYEEIIAQLKSDLNAECAIANKYGIILGSKIKEFSVSSVGLSKNIVLTLLSSLSYMM